MIGGKGGSEKANGVAFSVNSAALLGSLEKAIRPQGYRSESPSDRR